jgi:hypothetical protein
MGIVTTVLVCSVLFLDVVDTYEEVLLRDSYNQGKKTMGFMQKGSFLKS